MTKAKRLVEQIKPDTYWLLLDNSIKSGVAGSSVMFVPPDASVDINSSRVYVTRATQVFISNGETWTYTSSTRSIQFHTWIPLSKTKFDCLVSVFKRK